MRICITGGKGGTGKSIVATSLAVEFARDCRAMLVDADVECPNDHLLLSLEMEKYKTVYQPIPKWDFDKCNKCGKCASVCKQNAIVFAKGKYPAFVKDVCIGCKACMLACTAGAITETKKNIGTIYTGKNYGVNLVSGELKIGEIASGEVVAKLRELSEKINKTVKAEKIIIDSAAGVGCPVIASMTGTDYVVAVTEPTPSALHDLKRALHLAKHFGIEHGIVINKCNLDVGFCSEIEDFAKENRIPLLGKIPYSRDFLLSTIQMKPAVEMRKDYSKLFVDIISKIM
ncbi:MAG: ATP-binding protein [Candidatus Aenigmarchaeota archaeon]|nr:ATP-binding protein [Candidatus Aenigmarchaeota archaeon]